MPENKEAEIRSDEVQEILSHIPNWMIRWGISFTFGIILLLVFVAWFIKYPDTVEGQVIVTTKQAPVKLISKRRGYIQKLYVENNTIVEKDQIIAEIMNSTTKETTEYLLNLINFETFLVLDTNLVFGEIQAEYNSFIKNIHEYKVLENDNYYQNSLRQVTQQITFNKQLALITLEQLSIMKQELVNASEKFQTDSTLFSKDYSSRYDFYKNQTELNNKKNEYINLKKTLIQYQITATQYEKERDDLTKKYEEKERDLKNNIAINKKNIKNYIESWQQNFTLVSPINGQLSYVTNISKNVYIDSDSPLFVIIPNDETYVGVVTISSVGYGKIKKGQKVRIKLHNYPYEQYGQLLGEVYEISQITNKENYLLKVKLNSKLVTTYNKKIEYSPEMSGTAEVITKDLRLLERIFNTFRKVFDE